MRLEHEIAIAAPASVVWDLTADVERWPEITPTMTTVQRLDEGPLAVGSQARIKQPRQGERTWTVTRLEPGRSFAWATNALGMRMEGGHTITGDERACLNLLTLDVTGLLAPVLGRLLAGQLRKAIATENEGFKATAEART
jgi:uncharacterized membrane protein